MKRFDWPRTVLIEMLVRCDICKAELWGYEADEHFHTLAEIEMKKKRYKSCTANIGDYCYKHQCRHRKVKK